MTWIRIIHFYERYHINSYRSPLTLQIREITMNQLFRIYTLEFKILLEIFSISLLNI